MATKRGRLTPDSSGRLFAELRKKHISISRLAERARVAPATVRRLRSGEIVSTSSFYRIQSVLSKLDIDVYEHDFVAAVDPTKPWPK